MSKPDVVLAQNKNIKVLGLDDPYTPVMVEHQRLDCRNTIVCVEDTGHLEDADYYELVDADWDLLEANQAKIDNWYNDHIF